MPSSRVYIRQRCLIFKRVCTQRQVAEVAAHKKTSVHMAVLPILNVYSGLGAFGVTFKPHYGPVW